LPVNITPAPTEFEPVRWSAVVNGRHVRLVISDKRSAWRCDRYEFAQPSANRPPSCEHVRFSFDPWFGRESQRGVIVTDIHDYSRRH